MSFSPSLPFLKRARTGQAALLRGLAALLVLGVPAQAGFHISGTKLLDGNGTNFIMRGVNHAYSWCEWPGTPLTQAALSGMAGYKVNTVRVVLSNGKNQYTGNNVAADQVAQIVQWCKDNQIIAVLEMHACTGYGDTQYAPYARPIQDAVDYWKSLAAVLKGQEDYVIINIANEPIGNALSSSQWVSDASSAIRQLRDAGFEHTFMIDAANWGQDWSRFSLDNASQVWAADRMQNTIFSVHMYDSYKDFGTIDTYLSSFQGKGLPLVVGEFATSQAGNSVDAKDVMERCQHYGLGYMGWVWCNDPRAGQKSEWDIVTDWKADALTTWGKLLMNDDNGIVKTSEICSIFADLKLNPGSVSLPLGGGNSAVSVTSKTTWTAVSDQSWLTVVSNGSSFTVSAAANPGATRSANVKVTNQTSSKVLVVTQNGAAQVNIAKGKPVVVSSTEGSLAGTNAVDDNPATRWSSLYSDPQWITVDLGTSYKINQVVLAWETAYGKSYKIQTSQDNATWTDAYSTSTGKGGTESIPVSATGRYVRLQGSARGTQWGYSLWEFQVFGTPDQPHTLSVDPTSSSFPINGGSNSITVNSDVAWTATSNQSWLTVGSGSGTSNGSFSLTAPANTGSADRSATVTVSGPAGSGLGQQISVTQKADNPTTLDVTPGTLGYASAVGSKSVAITSNSNWTASADQSWVSLSSNAGSGNGSVSVSLSANTGAAARTATLTFKAGTVTRTVTITQDGQGQGEDPATVSAKTAAGSSQWYAEQDVVMNSTAPISALSLTVNVAKTAGVSFNGSYTTIGSQVATGHSETASGLVYNFTLQPGSTLNAGSFTFASQVGLNGTVHPNAGDTWTITYTANGKAYSHSGTF